MVVATEDSPTSRELPEHQSFAWYDRKGPRPVLTSCCHRARPSRQSRTNIGGGAVSAKRPGVLEAFGTVEEKWEVSFAACVLSFWLSGAHFA